jgi:hypothetical protein
VAAGWFWQQTRPAGRGQHRSGDEQQRADRELDAGRDRVGDGQVDPEHANAEIDRVDHERGLPLLARGDHGVDQRVDEIAD